MYDYTEYMQEYMRENRRPPGVQKQKETRKQIYNTKGTGQKPRTRQLMIFNMKTSQDYPPGRYVYIVRPGTTGRTIENNSTRPRRMDRQVTHGVMMLYSIHIQRRTSKT